VSRAITYAASLDEVFQLTVDRAADLLGRRSRSSWSRTTMAC
jgi:hypothetical protein